jgi:uncharacterized coiled-coil protein SlyX
MPTTEALEARIIELESLLARQERLLDELNEEILRLNRLHERLLLRIEAQEARANEVAIRALSDEPPPPHY